jgi:hypothetical protein
MDKFAFFKDQYYKEIDRKNDITSSFSTPIGIISALVAGIFYSLTTFDFSFHLILSLTFVGLVFASIIFLGLAIFHLIKALSDFHDGFNYAYLNNADELDNYHRQLKEYYKQSNIADTSDTEFDDYVLSELIKSTAINQKNNDKKIYHRFLCNKFMVSTFLVLCVLTIPFGVNFSIKKAKPNIQNISIDSTLNVNLKTKQNQSLIDSAIIKLYKMEEENEKKVEKPLPPPTKMLTEGEKPKTETRTFSSQDEGNTKGKKK